MAAQLVRSATLENEAHLLQLAASSTVARMKERLLPPSDDAFVEPDGERLCTLTLTENHEDALLFECAHRLARHLGATTTSDVVDALIGEATSSLMPLIPKDAADPNDLAPSLDAQNAYIRQRNQFSDRPPSWIALQLRNLDSLESARGVSCVWVIDTLTESYHHGQLRLR